MIVFERPNPQNTDKVLDILDQALTERDIKQVVVASTCGTTALKAANLLKDKGINLVVVTHNVGFKEPGTLEMTLETRKELEGLGAKVHTGTMVFRNIGTAIRAKQGYCQQDLIANTLRIFCQGIKVCVEIVLMASDAGLIRPEDVLSVAGTGRGADTLALIYPTSSNNLFDLKVREILAKPRDW